MTTGITSAAQATSATAAITVGTVKLPLRSAIQLSNNGPDDLADAEGGRHHRQDPPRTVRRKLAADLQPVSRDRQERRPEQRPADQRCDGRRQRYGRKNTGGLDQKRCDIDAAKPERLDQRLPGKQRNRRRQVTAMNQQRNSTKGPVAERRAMVTRKVAVMT